MTTQELIDSMWRTALWIQWFVQNYRHGELMFADGRIFGPWF